VDRRKKIYAIAQAWDLIIMEDGKSTERYHRTSSDILLEDPYYFLQYDTPQTNCASTDPDEFIKNFRSTLIPTFLSMDVDGRVLRIDTSVPPACNYPFDRIHLFTGSAKCLPPECD